MSDAARSNWALTAVWPPLLFLVFLGYALHISRGHYNDVALILVTMGWIGFVVGGVFSKAKASVQIWRALRILLWGVLVFFLYKLLRDSMVHYVISKTDQRITRGLLFVSFGLAVSGMSLNLRSEHRFGRWILWGIAALLLVARVFVLRSSPTPFIDVFTVPTDAAKYLIHGMNPYAQSYQDIYHGFYGYKPTFAYWPGVLLPETMAYCLFGDIRYVFIFADIVTFFCMAAIYRRLERKESSSRWLIPVIWLSFPPALFVLEQSWVDNLIIASGSVFLLMVLEKRWIATGIALGFLMSVKQYTIFFAVLSLILLALRRNSWREFWKTVAVAGGMFLLVLGPFILWDWNSFYSSTVELLLGIEMRTDALTWVAALQRNIGWTMPGALMSATYLVFLGLAALVLGIPLLRGKGRSDEAKSLLRWSYGLVLVYGVVFLLGKQAFCNYYYLLAFFVCLHLLLAAALGGASAEGDRA